MVARRLTKVGDKFKLKCGVTVEVVEYTDSRHVLVEDKLGNQKIARTDTLKAGIVGWEFNNPEWQVGKKPSDIREGEVYPTKYGNIEVVEFKNCRDVLVKFTETGFVKKTTSANIIKGKVKDNTKSPINKHQVNYPIGSWWESRNSGKFEIVGIDTCKNITIKWENSGHTQKYVSSARINDGNLVDESFTRDYLKPEKGKHYVYTVHFKNEIIYIGHGFALRYLHPNSGASHVKELNRIYFMEEGSVVIKIQKDGLSKQGAVDLEKSLIAKHKPYCNSIIYRI